MFGLFMLLLYIIVRIAVSVQDANREQKSKEISLENGYDIYTDRRGITRRVYDDKPSFKRWDYKTGHVFEVNPCNGQVYRDITADAQDAFIAKEKAKALKEGRKYYLCERFSAQKHGADKIKGARYKSVDDNNTYIRRRVSNVIGGGVPWYINIETGLFEEPDRAEIKPDEKYQDMLTGKCFNYETEENIQELKNVLNKEQAETIQTYGLSHPSVWMNDYCKIWDLQYVEG